MATSVTRYGSIDRKKLRFTALKNGNISVRIDTAKFPAGEVKGTFIQGSGSKSFTAPASPPTVALTNVSATDAARFLTQATFGPKKSEIDALTGGSIDAWITAQMAKPATSHRTATVYDLTISFSLDVTFNAADVEHVDGRAIFHLERATLGDPWRATRWQDASTL